MWSKNGSTKIDSPVAAGHPRGPGPTDRDMGEVITRALTLAATLGILGFAVVIALQVAGIV